MWHETLLQKDTFTHQPAIWHLSPLLWRQAPVWIDQRLLGTENKVSTQKAGGCLLTPYLLQVSAGYRPSAATTLLFNNQRQQRPGYTRIPRGDDKKSIFQEKCILRKWLQQGQRQRRMWPRCPGHWTCWEHLLPLLRVAAPSLHHCSLCGRREALKRGRFLSLWGYHLAIHYVLPTPLFPRLPEEQKQLLTKI